jgi:hypothetical protein
LQLRVEEIRALKLRAPSKRARASNHTLEPRILQFGTREARNGQNCTSEVGFAQIRTI